MKKLILPILSIILLLSCKKERNATQPIESSNQLLTKVIKTADYGGATFSVNYEYNDAGKLVKEGNTTYERDGQQRIARILDPGTASNRADIQVHYKTKNGNQIDYTFCKMTNIDASDSIVYLHDDNGKLVKTMSYITYYSNPEVPAIAFLYEYDIFNYDPDGNMIHADDYKRDYDGKEVHCWEYIFLNYDNGINPLYTGDEVRATTFFSSNPFINFYGVINNSMNNFTSDVRYRKTFEYRADGRPKSCLVQQNGSNVFRLIYEYK